MRAGRANRALLSDGTRFFSRRPQLAGRAGWPRRALLSDGTLGADRPGPSGPAGRSGRTLLSLLASRSRLTGRTLRPRRSGPTARPRGAGGAGLAHLARLSDHDRRRPADLHPGLVGTIQPIGTDRRLRQDKPGRQGQYRPRESGSPRFRSSVN